MRGLARVHRRVPEGACQMGRAQAGSGAGCIFVSSCRGGVRCTVPGRLVVIAVSIAGKCYRFTVFRYRTSAQAGSGCIDLDQLAATKIPNAEAACRRCPAPRDRHRRTVRGDREGGGWPVRLRTGDRGSIYAFFDTEEAGRATEAKEISRGSFSHIPFPGHIGNAGARVPVWKAVSRKV